jgi:hypothetical protein
LGLPIFASKIKNWEKLEKVPVASGLPAGLVRGRIQKSGYHCSEPNWAIVTPKLLQLLYGPPFNECMLRGGVVLKKRCLDMFKVAMPK